MGDGQPWCVLVAEKLSLAETVGYLASRYGLSTWILGGHPASSRPSSSPAPWPFQSPGQETGEVARNGLCQETTCHSTAGQHLSDQSLCCSSQISARGSWGILRPNSNRKGNFELKTEELQNSPSLEADFKRQLIAQHKGQYKKDGRWLIDFDLLTCLQADRPTGPQAGAANILGNEATVPLLLKYNDGVRGKPHSLTLQVHLRQTPAG